MKATRLRLLISGRVQGVGFRAFVVREGRALGLVGTVRNLDDGRVEAAFSGDPEKVEALRAACGRGPAHARVETVEVAPIDENMSFPKGFVTIRDGRP